MSDVNLLHGLCIIVSCYGAVRLWRGHWSGAILCIGVGALAFAS